LNTPESKAKRSAAAKISLARPEVIEKRASIRADPAYGTKISESLKILSAFQKLDQTCRPLQPGIREKKLAALRAAMARPETRAKLVAASKASWADPTIRANREAAFLRTASRPDKKGKTFCGFSWPASFRGN
jgi:hypothetical protein